MPDATNGFPSTFKLVFNGPKDIPFKSISERGNAYYTLAHEATMPDGSVAMISLNVTLLGAASLAKRATKAAKREAREAAPVKAPAPTVQPPRETVSAPPPGDASAMFALFQQFMTAMNGGAVTAPVAPAPVAPVAPTVDGRERTAAARAARKAKAAERRAVKDATPAPAPKAERVGQLSPEAMATRAATFAF